MYRNKTCGELRLIDAGTDVTICGWVQRMRDMGGMTFIDLRDRYGITQLVFNMDGNQLLCTEARKLGREFVISVSGKVTERSNKNPKMETGEIEILVDQFTLLNASKVPPFTIEDESDGGEDLRMKFRYLDIRRNPVKEALVLRHRIAQETRKFFDAQGFIEVETPVLIKSTPEGARDFIVPSRMNPGGFYALPQSPQTFKQLLMVAGMDRYFQLVKCFRDEDLRADRQPEFTQVDCEMAFVEREDILQMFEKYIKTLFEAEKKILLSAFPRMSFEEAMRDYGNDKPDLRFGMKLNDITSLVKGKNFKVLDEAETVQAIVAEGCSAYTRRQLDELTEFVKRPQTGASGMIYVKYNTDETIRSSVDKFYSTDDLKHWISATKAKAGDLILVLAGASGKIRKAMSELRLEMGNRLGLRKKDVFSPLWVIDFPLLEWDDELKRYQAMHHPFTSPLPEDTHLMDTDAGRVRANAYDLVINGQEIGGGSIRIHDRNLQQKLFSLLGFTQQQAESQFGFLMNAFEYGAPPHGGIAFGFDRLCALFGGSDSIRDYIAFPKNNSGRDVMIDAPAPVSKEQLDELGLEFKYQL
ncbi:MAG: aspartate--tRNA ligase [Bacteroidia bacterium]|nr:aspartate--tRNA ligase [Bacteroidia bacterium]MCZ2277892.1 aspartate--tRNA ligase [Bacteroidia bacterium]